MKQLLLLTTLSSLIALSSYGQVHHSDKAKTAGDITLLEVLYPNFNTIDNVYQSDGYYTSRPDNQVLPFVVSGQIQNSGTAMQTNVRFIANVYNSSANNVFYGADSIPSLDVATSDSLGISDLVVPNIADDYLLTVCCDQAEGDTFPGDNCWPEIPIHINDNHVIKRHQEYNDSISMMGLNASNGEVIGITFSVTSPDEISSIAVFIDSSSGVGGIIIGQLYYSDLGSLILQVESEEHIIDSTDLNNWIDFSLVSVDPTDNDVMPNASYYAAIEVYYDTTDIIIGSDNSGIHEYQIETGNRYNPNWPYLDEIPLIEIRLDGYTPPINMVNYKKTNTIAVFPNPVKSILNITLSNKSETTSSVSITDISGNLIRTENVRFGKDGASINTSTLTNGVYLLNVEDKTTSYQTKFVKL